MFDDNNNADQTVNNTTDMPAGADNVQPVNDPGTAMPDPQAPVPGQDVPEMPAVDPAPAVPADEPQPAPAEPAPLDPPVENPAPSVEPNSDEAGSADPNQQ